MEKALTPIITQIKDYFPATGAILLPHLGGIAGAFITKKEIPTWYKSLTKPAWTPPNSVFPPMWSALYTGMGVASYLIWRDGGGFNGRARIPLILYGSNLALNWTWPQIFFGAHKKGLALIELGFLWGTIGACAYTFWPINNIAAYLMLPYWAWMTFATALTYCIWRDNRDKTD